MEQDITTYSRDELFDRFSTSENGLSDEQVTKNGLSYGSNALVALKKESLFIQILKEFFQFFPLLLTFGGLLSFFAHSVTPGEGYNFIGYALLFVVILNAVVALVQKRKVQHIMSAFRSYIPEKVAVTRDGREQVISSQKLVVGDVIKLSEGDKVPSDAIILESHQMKVDESILTGESTTVDKEQYDQSVSGVLYSGTTLLQGNCVALVTAVGSHTKFGEIANLTQSIKQDLTPMQVELKRFVEKISLLAFIIGGFFFLLGFFYLEHPFWTNLIFAIGIIVANVPEGLLPTVTLALTQAGQRMARHKCVVKSLEAVETLGSCNVICTDKTGTLTQNQMTVSRVYLNNANYDAKNVGHDEFLNNPASKPFLEILAICNNAALVEEKHGRTSYYGDPTETALCSFVDHYENTQGLRQKFSVSYEKTFSSKDKFMSKVLATQDGAYTTVKGAPEVILKRSENIHFDGKVIPLTDEHRSRVDEQLHEYQKEGFRVLGLAYYTGDNDHDDPGKLVFVGLVALIDPPRPQVRDAIAACHTAGIRVVVVSGDNAETVMAIARETGITDKPYPVTGDVLANMSDEELDSVLEREGLVFARTAPEQKLRIVEAFKRRGDNVAVTGDGVNDAPALRKADIGVAMGASGTDVAKDAADIILLDDNFATIVHAIEEGRTVFDNIKKFITYVLTSNVPEIIPFIVYIVFYPHIPLALTVLQILTIDLITDILPSIGLGSERSEKDIMARPPRKRTERLVSAKTFLRSYGFIGPLEAVMAFGAFFAVLFFGGWTFSDGAYFTGETVLLYLYATSAFLATIICCQIGNVLACRTNRQSSFTKIGQHNKWLYAGVAVEVIAIIIILFLPIIGGVTFLQGYYSVSSEVVLSMVVEPLLSLGEWLVIAAIMFVAPIIIFFAEELRKLGARRGLRWLDV